MIQRRIELPLQTRFAPIGTFNADTRTVDVIFSTGATVRRREWRGWSDEPTPFDETLVVSADAINMDRLRAGAPVLDSHSAYSTFSQVGVVENPRVDNGRALSTVRFPSKGVDAAADRMAAMVAEGIIRNVSVGYSIDQVEVKRAEKVGDVEQRIATRWTPYELSFVTIPADSGAQTRAADDSRKFPVAIVSISPAIAAAARMRARQLSL